jgi:hypothetical protein
MISTQLSASGGSVALSAPLIALFLKTSMSDFSKMKVYRIERQLQESLILK